MTKYAWLLGLSLLGCGGRPEAWDKSFTASDPVALDNAVAVVDKPLSRALIFTSSGALGLHTDVLPVGQSVTRVQASPDGKRLFVLSRGVSPRRHPEDERPRLTLIFVPRFTVVEASAPLNPPRVGSSSTSGSTSTSRWSPGPASTACERRRPT